MPQLGSGATGTLVVTAAHSRIGPVTCAAASQDVVDLKKEIIEDADLAKFVANRMIDHEPASVSHHPQPPLAQIGSRAGFQCWIQC